MDLHHRSPVRCGRRDTPSPIRDSSFPLIQSLQFGLADAIDNTKKGNDATNEAYSEDNQCLDHSSSLF